MRKIVVQLAAVLVLSLLVAGVSFPAWSTAQDSVVQNPQNPVKMIEENVYQIGNLLLDGNQRMISMPGSVNMANGLIELFACAPGGKVHESVLVIDIEPYHLQVGLLMLGLEHRGNLEYQGDPATPDGDPVEIFVEWKNPASGKAESCRAEQFVYNVPGKHPMKDTYWVFTGSRVVNGVFAAQEEKSLVTTYHDPNTIIDNPLETGADDTFYEVNSSLVPPEGTKVTVIIKPYER
jgi:hypothetical protein